MKPYFPYDGWDWVELCKAFNIPCYDVSELLGMDYDESLWLKCYLQSVMRHCQPWEGGKNFVLHRTAFEVRTFLKELATDGHTYLGPMWKGMSEIEDDWSLISMFVQICDSAWD